MAITVAYVQPPGAPAVLKPKPPGDVHAVTVQVTGDTSYPTGGYAFGPAQMPTPFALLEAVEVDGITPNAVGATDATYNYSTGKLQFMQSSGAELANATNVSTVTVNLRVWGR